MSAISTILTRLRAAIWAIDVRDDIANAIEQCYSDVSNPTLQTEALEAALQNKIDEGEMAALTIGDHTITAAKLAQGVIDNTLATSGAAADAKKTGDEIAAVKAGLEAKGLTSDIKTALLNCLKNCGLKGDDGADSINALALALYGETYVVSISATFNAQGNTIHVLDGLNSLKQYLTVVATYSNGDTETITDYILTGKLKEGDCTITVANGLAKDTFTVTVSATVVETLTGDDLLVGGFSAQPTSYGTHYNRAISGYPRLAYTYFGMPIHVGYKYRFNFESNISGTVVTAQVRYLTTEALAKAQAGQALTDLNTDLLYFETGWKETGWEFTVTDVSTVVWFTLQNGTNLDIQKSNVTSVVLECIEAV